MCKPEKELKINHQIFLVKKCWQMEATCFRTGDTTKRKRVVQVTLFFHITPGQALYPNTYS